MLTREKVEEELGHLVRLAKQVVPRLTEIRVFGSYHNGNWNPEKSDIDVFVQMRGGQIFPYYKYQTYDMDDEAYNRVFPHRRYEQAISSGIDEDIRSRFDIHVFSFRDVLEFRGKKCPQGGIAKTMKRGKLIYSASRADLPSQLKLLAETFIPLDKLNRKYQTA